MSSLADTGLQQTTGGGQWQAPEHERMRGLRMWAVPPAGWAEPPEAESILDFICPVDSENLCVLHMIASEAIER